MHAMQKNVEKGRDLSEHELITFLAETMLAKTADKQAAIILNNQTDNYVLTISNGTINRYNLDKSALRALQDAMSENALKSEQSALHNEKTDCLTERQKEILTLVSKGLSAKELSKSLGISYFTVTTHMKNIYSSLQVNNKAEAIYEARRLGLISS